MMHARFSIWHDDVVNYRKTPAPTEDEIRRIREEQEGKQEGIASERVDKGDGNQTLAHQLAMLQVMVEAPSSLLPSFQDTSLNYGILAGE